jgi:hypothetical protein
MYPRYVTVLGERRMRKEGTDVGWCLRADLHQDGDPSGLPLGCHPRSARRCGGTSARQLRLRAGSAGRSRDRKSMRSARRSCGPIDLRVERDLVRVLVACGQGQPCVRWKSLARAHKETRTAGVMRMMLACGAGREEMPRRHPSHTLCRTATRRGSFPHSSTRVHSSGGGFRRFGHERSGREQAPAMGYGYRRGANLRRVERWWERGPRPSRLWVTTTAPLQPSEPHVRYRDATGPDLALRRKPSKW